MSHLIGAVPAARIAEEIALGQRNPVADESGDYALYDTASCPKPVDRIWCDGDIMDVPITADMVPGAELLPRSFIADFADLSRGSRAWAGGE